MKRNRIIGSTLLNKALLENAFSHSLLISLNNPLKACLTDNKVIKIRDYQKMFFLVTCLTCLSEEKKLRAY